MKTNISLLLFCLLAVFSYGQQEFHVTVDGKQTGNGTVENPWDLQTALNHPASLKDGDVLWLHGGVYSGRYKSKLQSSSINNKIVVSSPAGERAVLNGNVNHDAEAVLTVTGANVVYKNFDVVPTDLRIRNQSDPGFRKFTGIYHTSGTNCEFLNLRIIGNNGLGFGSWNKTGGSLIADCIISDNGFINTKGKGIGEGMYVQNSSEDEIRVIRDNLIFNNYYKGIEVWSAAKNPNRSYVKNVRILNNVIFNSGLVANRTVDNIIIATDDRKGKNIAKNITVKNNILFHDNDYESFNANGDAPSLTLGFRGSAAVENIDITDNIILGKNNPLRILHAKSLEFKNNTVYGGYVQINQSNFDSEYHKDWKFNDNRFFTKNATPFRLINGKKTSFKNWQGQYGFDGDSKWQTASALSLNTILDITQNTTDNTLYRITVFDDLDNDLEIDLSKYKLPKNTSYTIREVSDLNSVYAQGRSSEKSTLTIPGAKQSNIKKGVHVFLIQTGNEANIEVEKKSRLGRLLDLLGFN